jgi:hypothetical protein
MGMFNVFRGYVIEAPHHTCPPSPPKPTPKEKSNVWVEKEWILGIWQPLNFEQLEEYWGSLQIEVQLASRQ